VKIERYQNQKQGFTGCGCGLVVIGGVIIITILAVLIAPALPSLGLRLAGFQPIEQPISSSTAEPIPVIHSAQNPSQVILSAGSYGQRNISQSSAYTMQVGTDNSDTEVAQITVNEKGIATVCAQYSDVCSNNSATFRNASVDLQNNRATISGEAYISSLNTWQPIAVIVSLSPTNSIMIDAVEVNGTLFGIPDGELGQRIRDIQNTANQALQQLRIEASGEIYNLSDIVITEAQLVAIFR